MTDHTAAPMKVLVYSDDASVRQQVVLALGSRPAPELPTIEVTEVATEPIVRSIVAEAEAVIDRIGALR